MWDSLFSEVQHLLIETFFGRGDYCTFRGDEPFRKLDLNYNKYWNWMKLISSTQPFHLFLHQYKKQII